MTFKIISPGDLEYYLDRYNTILIDLREKEDFQKEHIPGAVWADWEKLEKNIGSMLMAYNTNPAWIILYCARGNISLLTARDLARMGYPVTTLMEVMNAGKHTIIYKNLISPLKSASYYDKLTTCSWYKM